MTEETMNLEKFRKLLLDEKARLEEKERKIEQRNSAASESGELGDLADYDNHPADSATLVENRAIDLAFDENISALKDQVDEALRKVADGSYGTCDRCGGTINPERLEAIPYATLCIDCQNIVEEF